MAFAPKLLNHFVVSFYNVYWWGFYSGTLDALVFDSLKSEGREEKFDKVISNLSSISLIAPAIFSIIGGFAYGFDPRLPFLLNAIGYTIGLVATLFLTEPYVDTEKFSLNAFINQTKFGLLELFKVLISNFRLY